MSEFIQSWSDGGYAAFTNFGVAALSLVIAIFAWQSSSNANRRLIEIEEGRDKKAEKSVAKARLIACIDNPAKHTYLLVIRNQGSGDARDIKVLLDGKDMQSHTAFPEQNRKAFLGPMSTCKYNLFPSLADPNPSSVRIEWVDDSGEPGVFESDL